MGGSRFQRFVCAFFEHSSAMKIAIFVVAVFAGNVSGQDMFPKITTDGEGSEAARPFSLALVAANTTSQCKGFNEFCYSNSECCSHSCIPISGQKICNARCLRHI